MIGADDLDDFFDPDEFGCEVRLVVGDDVIEIRGMLRPAPQPTELRQGNRSQGGVRSKPGERELQIAAHDLPADWPDRRVELDQGHYTAVEVLPVGRVRVGLVLVPYSERTTEHVQWLRD